LIDVGFNATALIGVKFGYINYSHVFWLIFEIYES